MQSRHRSLLSAVPRLASWGRGLCHRRPSEPRAERREVPFTFSLGSDARGRSWRQQRRGAEQTPAPLPSTQGRRWARVHRCRRCARARCRCSGRRTRSLVGLLRDHHLHAPGPETVAVGLGRVGLVPAQCVGGCARPARAAARDPELVQQHWQCRGITRIAGRQDQDQRQPTAVDQRMGLGCQAAAGTPDGVIVRFVPATQRFVVVRPSPLCER